MAEFPNPGPQPGPDAHHGAGVARQSWVVGSFHSPLPLSAKLKSDTHARAEGELRHACIGINPRGRLCDCVSAPDSLSDAKGRDNRETRTTETDVDSPSNAPFHRQIVYATVRPGVVSHRHEPDEQQLPTVRQVPAPAVAPEPLRHPVACPIGSDLERALPCASMPSWSRCIVLPSALTVQCSVPRPQPSQAQPAKTVTRTEASIRTSQHAQRVVQGEILEGGELSTRG
jgi:hypothetical protein